MEFFKKLRTSMIELAVAIGIVNLIAAMLLRAWCNKRIKDSQDKWKKLRGCNSVVEYDLAKVDVVGSSPTSRSNFFLDLR